MLPIQYMGPCLREPIEPSILWGGIWTVIDLVGGRPVSGPFGLTTWGRNSVFFFGYHAIQCPMKIIHGRESAWHDVAAGGLIGYIGVSRGYLGVPFVNPYFVYGSRNPGLIGAAVVRIHSVLFTLAWIAVANFPLDFSTVRLVGVWA